MKNLNFVKVSHPNDVSLRDVGALEKRAYIGRLIPREVRFSLWVPQVEPAMIMYVHVNYFVRIT